MRQAAKNMIDQVMDPDKFDRRTHIWDAHGNLIKKNLYIEYIIKGDRFLERPVNSGNLWTEGNQPAGRVEKTFSPSGAVTSKQFHFDAAHIEYKPVLTGDEALHYELEQERGRRAELEAELAAIRKESKPADKPEKPMPLAAMAVAAEPQLPRSRG